MNALQIAVCALFILAGGIWIMAHEIWTEAGKYGRLSWTNVTKG
jgi:hypothetical protein